MINFRQPLRLPSLVLIGISIWTLGMMHGTLWSQNLQWAKGLNEVGNTIGIGLDVEHDAAGNIYALGRFLGTVDFDHGSGNVLIASQGSYDVFVLKTDAYGNFIWVRTFGSPNEEIAGDLAVDGDANVYVAGSFAGGTDFDGGPGTVYRTPNATSDIFLLKLDSSGNYLDVDQYGTTGDNVANAVDVDTAGNVVMAGNFRGTIDFDPGPGVASVSATSTVVSDVFVQKVDPAGNFVWAKRVGAGGADYGFAVATDASGDVVIVGGFQSSVDFDPGLGTFTMASVGVLDAFVLKLNAAGNFVWAKRMGGSGGQTHINGLAVGPNGEVATVGDFDASGDFDPGAGVNTLTCVGSDDIFVQNLDAGGNLLWVNSWGSTNAELGYDIGFDSFGKVYFSGAFGGLLDFDASAVGVLNVSSVGGSSDGFVECLDLSGALAWFGKIGGTLGESILGLDVYHDGTTVCTGRYGSLVDCDPGSGYYAMQPQGSNTNIFTMKWGPCMASRNTFAVQGCDSFAYHGSVFQNTGTYEKVLTNQANCDSIVTLLLEIKEPTTSTLVVDTCGAFWLNGQTFTTSGTYTQVIPNHAGCDSTITLQLTTRATSATLIVDSACVSYNLNGQVYTQSGTYTQVFSNAVGCDSVITLHFTALQSAHSVTVAACDSFLFAGQMLDSSGIYAAQYVNQYGCDSVESIHLTITHLQATATLSGDTLTAGPNGGIYQWVDCDHNDSPIAGATAQFFVPSVSGNYAALVSYGPCSERSACVPVTIVGLRDAHLQHLTCYPVPSKDRVSLDWGKVDDVEIELHDMYGARLQHLQLHDQSKTTLTLPETAGIYFLRVKTQDGWAVVKAVKN